MEQPKLRWRIFILSFGITFLLFSIGAALAVFVVNPPVQPYHPKVESSALDHYLPAQEESFTVLLALGDTAAPHTYLLVGFEPFQGSIPILGLSPETVLEDGSTLGEHFVQAGVEGAAQALRTALGVAIERTAHLTDEGIVSTIQSFGPVEYLLQQAVVFSAMGNRVELTAGVHRLTGEELLAVLSYQGYQGGELERVQTAAQLLCAGIDQYAGMVNQLDTDALYRQLTAHMQTDVSYEDAAGHMQALRFLVRLKEHIAEPLSGKKLFYQEQGAIHIRPEGKRFLQEQLHTQPEEELVTH